MSYNRNFYILGHNQCAIYFTLFHDMVLHR
ncbi:hypothetical protein RSAG8_04266, partial [Rhizoctonia solani AG-8 WAC10335]